MKGMEKFLDVEAEPCDGGDSDNDDTGSDDNIGTGDATPVARGDNTHVRSPSPKCCWTLRGEPTCKKKKLDERILPTMVIPEEMAVRFETDLLDSTLPTTLAKEDVLAEPPNAAGVPEDLPILGSPKCTTMQSLSSENGCFIGDQHRSSI